MLKNKMKVFGLAAAVLLGLGFGYNSWAQCGVLPVPPAGCYNRCQCDKNGMNCHPVVVCKL